MSALIKFLAELLGSFTLIGVIISVGKVIPTMLTLAAAIYVFGKPTGGHYNPAVSFIMFINGKITLIELGYYIIAQIIGGLLAYRWYIAQIQA